MIDYSIITDSTVDLPFTLTQQLNIEVVPLKFNMYGKERYDYPYCEGINIKDFYNGLRKGETSITTQVNPERFTDVFTRHLEEGKDILYIAFSSGLSGTFDSANIAADKLRDKYKDRNIIVVDSLCASMGEGLLVYIVVNMKKEGKTIFEIKEWIENNRLSVCHWFTVDDLHHLKRGGRISTVGAFLGSMFHVKPILHVDNQGHLKLVTKVRGRQKSLDYLSDKIGELGINVNNQTIFISHGDCQKDAENLASIIKSRYGVKDIKINNIGTVIGSHSGPGTIALFFIGRER